MRETLALILLLGATALPSGGRAQGPREEARRIFEEAERQFHAGNHQLALDGFVRSRELVAGEPRAAALILFNIARAQEELGRYGEAVEAFEQYLMDSPADAPFRQETQDRVRELRARLAASARPGPDRDSSSSPESPEPIEPPEERRGGRISPIGPVLIGVSGAAIVAGVIMGAVAFSQGQDLLGRCPSLMDCPGELRDDEDTARTLAIAADVTWVGGAILAATGLVLTLVLTDDGGDGERTAVRFESVPGGGLAALRGGF